MAVTPNRNYPIIAASELVLDGPAKINLLAAMADADVDMLLDAVAGKAAAAHQHVIADIPALVGELAALSSEVDAAAAAAAAAGTVASAALPAALQAVADALAAAMAAAATHAANAALSAAEAAKQSIRHWGALGGDPAADTAALVAALSSPGNYAIVPGDTVYIFSADEAQARVIAANWSKIQSEGPVTIKFNIGPTVFNSAAPILRIGPNSHNITLVGAAPIALTLTGRPTVTGSSGAWVVTYPTSSTAGAMVGGRLKNFQMGAFPLLNGDNPYPNVSHNRVLPNEPGQLYSYLGGLTFAAGGGSVSFNGPVPARVPLALAVNDLITGNGQTRQLSAVFSGGGNITGAWESVAAANLINYIVTRPNTGTVTISGNTATIAGGQLNSEADVGCILLADGEASEITGIISNTQCTVYKARTLAAATPYSIITPGGLHDGAPEITAVTANSVTVLHRGRSRPPVNAVTTGSLRVLNTVLKQTGTGGVVEFAMHGALPWIDNMVLAGPRTGDAIGVALGGRVPAVPLAIDGVTSFGSFTQHSYPCAMITGPDFAIADFPYNLVVGHGGVFNGRNSANVDSTIVGAWVQEGGIFNGRRAHISGHGNIGMQVNGGGLALITEIRLFSNFADSLRTEVGAVVYGEAPFAWGAGSMNYRFAGHSAVDLSQGLSAMAGASCYYLDHVFGEIKDTIILCARQANIDGQGLRDFVISRNFISGAGANGINFVNCFGAAPGNAITGNGNIGVYGNGRGDVTMAGTYLRNNGAAFNADARADGGAKLILTASRVPNAQVSGNDSLIDVTGHLGGAPALTGVNGFNIQSANGSVIRDGLAAAAGFASLKINGGSTISFAKMVSTVFDLPAIPSGEQVTFDVTVAGAAATGMTGAVNSNSIPAGVSLSQPVINAADTVRITAVANIAGSPNPGNATWTVAVTGYS